MDRLFMWPAPFEVIDLCGLSAGQRVSQIGDLRSLQGMYVEHLHRNDNISKGTSIIATTKQKTVFSRDFTSRQKLEGTLLATSMY